MWTYFFSTCEEIVMGLDMKRVAGSKMLVTKSWQGSFSLRSTISHKSSAQSPRSKRLPIFYELRPIPDPCMHPCVDLFHHGPPQQTCTSRAKVVYDEYQVPPWFHFFRAPPIQERVNPTSIPRMSSVWFAGYNEKCKTDDWKTQ